VKGAENVNTKITIIALCAMLRVLSASAEAEQPKNVPRIGFIAVGSRSVSQHHVDVFLQGLRDLSYVEDKNIVIDYRYGEGREDLLRDFAGDLVRLKVDIIVTASTVAALAAKQLTGTIPIVLAGTGDAVATGLVASLARPGGNVTGLSGVP
jgi:putative ABC transport system substrate-binding protein